MSDAVTPHALAGSLERYRPIVDDWPAFLDALARPLPTCVWTHPGRLTPRDLQALLAEEGLTPRPLDWHPGAFRLEGAERFGKRWWYRAGLCHAQEEVSALPVTLLAPRPGDRVLDLCAAPGGKTAQAALAVGTRGTVVANEVSVSRMRALRATVDRLSLANVALTNRDGCQFPSRAGQFDRVLVDPPCSDEGTLRKNPRLVEVIGERWSRERSGRQLALLRKGAQLCRPGGRVVYSTCTFSPEENEAVVDRLLQEEPRPSLRVVPVQAPGLRTAPGLTEWAGRRFDPELRHAVRIWPHHNDTGGFFVAVLEKTDGPAMRDAGSLRLEPAPEPEWLPHTGERFDIPEDVWEDYRVFRRTTRGLHVVSRDLRAPRAPEPQAMGLLLVKDRIRYPKLSTPGALLVGGAARRNFVELQPAQIEPYIAGATLALEPGQDGACTGTGYVVVRARGFALGTGLYLAGSGELRSLFPRRWHSDRTASTAP